MNKVNIIIFFYQSFQNISFTKFCLHYILCSIDFQVYQNKEKDPRKNHLPIKKKCKLVLNAHHAFSSLTAAVFQKIPDMRYLWQVHYYLETNLTHMAVNVKYGF